jgi:hypothetical protein
MSAILNDKDAIEIAAIQGDKPKKNHVWLHRSIGESSHDAVGSVK